MHKSRFSLWVSLGVLLLLVATLLVPTSTPHAHAQQAPAEVAEPFSRYYWQYNGLATFGRLHTPLIEQNGIAVQYFEQGRLEDHSAITPASPIAVGRLTVELMEGYPQNPISNTNLFYGDLQRYRHSLFPPPAGFTGGTAEVPGGVFVPFDGNLEPAPGYIVPIAFWNYITNTASFPNGWLADIGLPMTDVFEAQMTASDGTPQTVTLQAFERTILISDAAGTVSRAHLGTDMAQAMGLPLLNVLPERPTGPKRIEVDLTRQWVYAYEGDFLMYDFGVSTGKPGWETPTGSHVIFSKLRYDDMAGNANGESWAVADVPHVMYFAAGGYAFHGTWWHNSFGTGARLSHGCVNLSLDAAAILYDWAEVGTTVNVYY